MGLSIEKMTINHWEDIRAIYLAGIATGNATFEIEAPDWEHWKKTHLLECSIVARIQESIVGWAAMNPVSGRCVYSGVGEESVYIHPEYHRKGVGKALLQELIRLSEKQGFWTLQAGIFPENRSSLALHKKLGFREVGRRERIGKMNGVWRDVIFLERRSEVVGIS